MVELPLEMRTNAVMLPLIYPNVLGTNSAHGYSHSTPKVNGYMTITNTKWGRLGGQITLMKEAPIQYYMPRERHAGMTIMSNNLDGYIKGHSNST